MKQKTNTINKKFNTDNILKIYDHRITKIKTPNEYKIKFFKIIPHRKIYIFLHSLVPLSSS